MKSYLSQLVLAAAVVVPMSAVSATAAPKKHIAVPQKHTTLPGSVLARPTTPGLLKPSGSAGIVSGNKSLIGQRPGGNGIVAQGAGNIVAQGAGNLRGGNGIVAQGAGNFKPR